MIFKPARVAVGTKITECFVWFIIFYYFHFQCANNRRSLVCSRARFAGWMFCFLWHYFVAFMTLFRCFYDPILSFIWLLSVNLIASALWSPQSLPTSLGSPLIPSMKLKIDFTRWHIRVAGKHNSPVSPMHECIMALVLDEQLLKVLGNELPIFGISKLFINLSMCHLKTQCYRKYTVKFAAGSVLISFFRKLSYLT